MPFDSSQLRAAVAADSHVTIEDIPDGGTRFVIRPRPGDQRNIFLACLFFGMAVVAAGYFAGDWLGMNLGSANGSYLLMGLGALNTGIALVGALARSVQDPPRDTILEVAPGRLHADRVWGGDHMVSTYSPDNVSYLFVEEGTIWAAAKKGDLAVVPGGSAETMKLLAILAAWYLWNGQEVIFADQKIAGVSRLVIAPASFVEAQRESRAS